VNQKQATTHIPRALALLFIVLCSLLAVNCENPWMKEILQVKTITFNTNGGSGIGKQNVYKGERIARPSNPSKAGYTFVDWYTDNGNPWDFDNIPTADMTLHARWAEAYTVTFNSNGGTSVGSVTVLSGTPIDAPTPPTKLGYAFDGWYSNQELTNIVSFPYTVTVNIPLYAKWNFVSTHNIGDTGPGGGIVFYYDANGFTLYQTATDTVGITAHYLEVAATDQGTSVEWGGYGTTISGVGITISTTTDPEAVKIGTGRRNTLNIIEQLPSGETDKAAQLCYNYNGGGYDDWFLPSFGELKKLYDQKAFVGGISEDPYWSSSQSGNIAAWCYNFSNGGSSANIKNQPYYVRAIRAF